MNKDYYKILEISHAANEQEIKKAYRRLAMSFHPDRNEGDSIAEDHFKELQEAYEILSHPGRRSAYNQQRWYRYNTSQQHDTKPVTAYIILHKCKALNRYIATLDGFHINRNALNNYILQLMSPPNLKILILENDLSANSVIINELLKAAYPLPLQSIQKIVGLLATLAGDDGNSTRNIQNYLRDKKFSDYREKYLPLAVLVIAILLCIFIYLVSENGR